MSEDKAYFDLHATGVAYVSRVREVNPQRGEAFFAVTLSALHGSHDKVQYTKFDCRVNGAETKRRVRELVPAVKADKKVLVGFKIGDLYLDQFTYQSGDRQGKPGAVIKARLLKITWAKVEGEHVFEDEAATAAA